MQVVVHHAPLHWYGPHWLPVVQGSPICGDCPPCGGVALDDPHPAMAPATTSTINIEPIVFIFFHLSDGEAGPPPPSTTRLVLVGADRRGISVDGWGRLAGVACAVDGTVMIGLAEWEADPALLSVLYAEVRTAARRVGRAGLAAPSVDAEIGGGAFAVGGAGISDAACLARRAIPRARQIYAAIRSCRTRLSLATARCAATAG